MMIAFLKRLLKRPKRPKLPTAIGTDIFLIEDEYQEFWRVRVGNREAHIHAPFTNMFGRRNVTVSGVLQKNWEPPYRNVPITPAEKEEILLALVAYLVAAGYEVKVARDDKTPPLQCKLDQEVDDEEDGER